MAQTNNQLEYVKIFGEISKFLREQNLATDDNLAQYKQMLLNGLNTSKSVRFIDSAGAITWGNATHKSNCDIL